MLATTSPGAVHRRPPELGSARAAKRAVYRPRNPTATPLYPIVQHHLETFLARAAEADPLGDGVAFWVENDFRAYLRCGILAHGFARARCDGCGSERLIAFSCRGRGVCPSCNTRRMVEVAAHLNDDVLPPLTIRQWVLSLPKRLRPFLHHDPALAGAVLAILLRAVRATLAQRSPGAQADAQLAAVSFPHRFGSSLNPHFHFHVVVLDGLFSQGDDGTLRFHEATGLGCEDVERLAHTIQRRVLRHFVRRGLLDDYAAHDMLTWQATGGFSLNASVRVEGHDRAGRERLLRYCARPPFALERLIIETAATAGDDGHGANAGVRRVIYRLPKATPDGRTILTLSPLEFLDAIARLIPPPRVHRQRYHGVLAPNARLRPAVTAWARQATQQAETGSDKPPTLEPHAGELAAAPSPSAADPAKQLPSRPRSTRARLEPHSAAPASATSSLWARLIARIYEVFPLLCSSCGGQLRILAFLTPPEPVHAILDHLGLPSRPPPLSPARAPPKLTFDFDQRAPEFLHEHDQTPAFDAAHPEPIPVFEYDQTRGA